MEMHMRIQIISKLCMLTALIATSSGCGCCGSTKSEVVKPALVEYRVQDVPGAVEYIWEEPMVDVVDIPPGLDPEGHYYRPGHQEVVEIRQGRWQYYKRPQQ
jgi:hypothetical protein